jgi:hypothetical protein
MSAHSAIRIPNLNAHDTASYATALLTAAEAEAAKAKKGLLPHGIDLARQRLITSLAALQAVLTPTDEKPDTQAQKRADQTIDDAWGFFHGWLFAWANAPLDNQEAASDLYQLLFSQGLAFLRLAYTTEYQESDSRLRALTPDHEALIDSLGGTPLLQYLRECHEAYGVALGITEVKATPAKTGVKTELDACRGAIREYLAKVVAYEDPDIEGSSELVAGLTAPATTWKAPKKKKASDTPPVNPPAPTPAPAADPKKPS